MTSQTPPWTERLRTANGVRLHCLEAGPEDGPLTVLLHGFPEDSRAWKHQIGPLARAGFRVVAPDMRGYQLSDKPAGVEAYQIDHLIDDVVALIHSLGHDRAHVVGHDWGGIVAWAVAIRNPEVVDRLVILNSPHPAAARRELHGLKQKKRSWYVGFFQLPWLPEKVLPSLGRKALEGARPGSFSPADLAGYQAAWALPGAATSMINYYRALIRFGNVRGTQVQAPTLLMWGMQDTALVPELTEGLEPWVPDLRVVRFPQATHWVLRDEAVRVSNLLTEFLS
ncbi:alpha/beta fold hydrolase [Deinococcus sp. Marseille-Q6407]|uniref:alpha/beta fold hydrolase n=1 Tax=Deinococcus sp. Marseille-Q6407 TaxID=2969223 RepID=UPI0021BDF9BF|nr:alpha/beta fold hydrolase [Deinococcus sp. Marseille-Q6407]